MREDFCHTRGGGGGWPTTMWSADQNEPESNMSRGVAKGEYLPVYPSMIIFILASSNSLPSMLNFSPPGLLMVISTVARPFNWGRSEYISGTGVTYPFLHRTDAVCKSTQHRGREENINI